MSALVLLLVCATACALPSNKNIIQDVEEINRLDVIRSANKPTIPSTGRRLPSVGIVGGKNATIEMYPFAAAILATLLPDLNRWYYIGVGTILNTRSVLTTSNLPECVKDLRFRVGSSLSLGGGTVYNTSAFITHPNSSYYYDNNIAIVRSATTIVYVPHAVQPAVLAPAIYNLADNEKVWVMGWGNIREDQFESDQLRHVQIYTINQRVCKRQYRRTDPACGDLNLTDNMMCAGVPDIGGKGACGGDEGAPLIHKGVVVGLSSWACGCGRRLYPSVYMRVSLYADWIEKNK